MLLILTWSIAAHSDPIKVYVRNEAQVALGNITLGAVADIVSTNVDDERQLGALILGESPKPGEKVEWPSAEISRRLRPYGRILQGVTLRVPDKIIVRRVVKGFTREALRKQFEDALKQTLPDSSWEVGLTELNIPDELQIPHDGSVQVVPLQNRPRGAVQFEVDVIENGRIVQRRYFNGHVAFKAAMAVAL